MNLTSFHVIPLFMFHAKKVMSVSLGLEDFAFDSRVDSDLPLSNKQVAFLDTIFVNIQMTEVL